MATFPGVVYTGFIDHSLVSLPLYSVDIMMMFRIMSFS